MKTLTNNFLYKKLRSKTISLIDKFRDVTHLYESEHKLASDNQKFWNKDYSNPIVAQEAHWKNNGKFEDQQRWLNLGKEHLDLIMKYSSVIDLQLPFKQVVEWGCGGGANAVHFAPLTEKFIGIDITSESLAECNKQILELGYNNFQPILMDATTPEMVMNHKISGIDLFLCLYVFEQFPSPDYGLTVLKLGNKMLKNDGIAFIQIRYNDGRRKGMKPKRWGYMLHPYRMTTYSLEEFWEKSKECGFEPLGIYLIPEQPLVGDHSYAYFFLKKKNEN